MCQAKDIVSIAMLTSGGVNRHALIAVEEMYMTLPEADKGHARLHKTILFRFLFFLVPFYLHKFYTHCDFIF